MGADQNKSARKLVLKQASAILRDAEKFHAQQKAFVNERLEPWTKS